VEKMLLGTEVLTFLSMYLSLLDSVAVEGGHPPPATRPARGSRHINQSLMANTYNLPRWESSKISFLNTAVLRRFFSIRPTYDVLRQLFFGMSAPTEGTTEGEKREVTTGSMHKFFQQHPTWSTVQFPRSSLVLAPREQEILFGLPSPCAGGVPVPGAAVAPPAPLPPPVPKKELQSSAQLATYPPVGTPFEPPVVSLVIVEFDDDTETKTATPQQEEGKAAVQAAAQEQEGEVVATAAESPVVPPLEQQAEGEAPSPSSPPPIVEQQPKTMTFQVT